MRNIFFRKGLVLGIICLLMLMTPIIPALNVFEKDMIKEVTSGQNVAGPDLVITDVWWEWDEFLFIDNFVCQVLNCGNGPVPPYKTKKVDMFVLHRFLPKIIYQEGTWREGNFPPHEPGKYVHYESGEPQNVKPYRKYRIYFWVDPGNSVKEIDSTNNGVWAYYYFNPSYIVWKDGVFRISPFYSWITDGEHNPWIETVENVDLNEHSQSSQQTSNFDIGIGDIANE